jgi:hypothetical protein
MGKKVGFTGTSKGASPAQLAELEERLKKLKEEGFDELHHGWCIGADEQAAIIAKRVGFRVIAHPGTPKDPKNMMYRSEWNENDEVRPEKPFIERDHDIVDETERMLATPLTRAEMTRSGTWTTVRYARKQSRPIDLILPPFVPPKYVQVQPPRTNAIAGEDPRAIIKRGLK